MPASKRHDTRFDLESVNRQIDALTFGLSKADSLQALRVPAFRRIVAAVDGSAASDWVADWAGAVAHATKGRVLIVAVAAKADAHTKILGRFTPRSHWKEVVALFHQEAADASKTLERARSRVHSMKAKAETHLLHGAATHEILKFAKTRRADLIILGGRGHSALDRFLLGSVADGVRNQAVASVLIARGKPGRGRVLIATDGSRPSRRAALAGLRLARARGAPCDIAHVYSPPLMGTPLEGKMDFKAIIESQKLPRAGPDVEYHLLYGKPAQQLDRFAQKRGHQVIVIGSRGMGGAKSLVLGSVSSRVSSQAHTSTLIVKDGRT